jgi:hypothetical protein
MLPFAPNSNLLQLNLRKMVSCLEQHNGLQLTDAVPSIVEVLNMNCTVLKSLNVNSLIQIGYYVLQDVNAQHKETNEYISTLVTVLLNSTANENKEERALKENFLFAVWCKAGTAVFISSLCIILETKQVDTL